jgi:hypothetical protein
VKETIAFRSDDSALNHNLKLWKSQKETMKVVKGVHYHGVIVNVEESTSHYSHTVTMEYDPETCYKQTPYREWREEQ